MDFNYKLYLENYADLRHYDEAGALNHWQNYGIKEGRTFQKRIYVNDSTNVTIIIHLFHENLLDEFISYIKNVQDVFKNVNVIFTIQQNSNIEEKIKSIDSQFVTIPVENKGVDIYPFLVAIKYMRTHFVTDFILKIHTKISSNISEGFIEWRKDLIEPITTYKNLLLLEHYFKKIKNIGYVGSQKCILPKNFDMDKLHNIEGINNFCKKFPHLENNWTDFVAGTMFWISNDTLNQINDEMIDYISNNVSNGKPPSNIDNRGIHLEYICERVFTGVLCYDKTNILINNFSITCESNSLNRSISNNSQLYSPRVFSIYHPKMLNSFI